MVKHPLLASVYVAALAGLSCSCGSRDAADIGYNDYRLFERTPLKELARAVEQEDTAAIRSIFRRQRPDADFAEPKFGNTLLLLTVANRQYEACRALLASYCRRPQARRL